MILIGQDVLCLAGLRMRTLKKWLERWAKIVENAEWNSLKSIRKAYPTADGVKLRSGAVVTVFNAKGNDYRLLTAIDFDSGIVEASEVLPHPEYSKNLWKHRY